MVHSRPHPNQTTNAVFRRRRRGQKLGFQMKSLFGEDAILGAPNGRGIIEPTPLFLQLLEEATDKKPKAIAIDASADVFSGNEIDRSHVRQFVGSLLRRLAGATDGAVILLSHPS